MDGQIERAIELLRQVHHTLYWHSHIDKDTDLHKRIEAFLDELDSRAIIRSEINKARR